MEQRQSIAGCYGMLHVTERDRAPERCSEGPHSRSGEHFQIRERAGAGWRGMAGAGRSKRFMAWGGSSTGNAAFLALPFAG